MNRRLILVIIIVILLVFATAIGWWFAHRVAANEFIGKVKKIEGDVLIVEGVYVVKDRPDLSNPSNSKTVSVTIDKSTKIIKERLFLPTVKEVEKTGGRFEPSKLKREAVAGSVGDFQGGEVSITIMGSDNIYGRSVFTAKEIKYIEPVFP